MMNARKSLKYICIAVLAVCLGFSVGIFGYLGLAALLVVIVVAFLLEKPQWSLYALLFCLPLGQLGRIPPASTGSAIEVSDIIAIILLFQWFIFVIRTRRWPKFSKAGAAWGGFLLVALIALVLTPLHLPKKELLLNGSYWLRLCAYTSLAWIVPKLLQTKGAVTKFSQYWFYAAQAVLLLGYLQLFVFPNLGPLVKYGWDPHVGRMVSTFLDPNFLGGYFALILSYMGALLITQPKQKLTFWLLLLAFIAGTILTFSRSGYLAAAVVVLIVGIRYSWKLLLVATICVGIFSLSVPRIAERVSGGLRVDATAQDRIQSWQDALFVSEYYPVLGVGYNNYKDAQVQFGDIPVGSTSHSASGSDSSLLTVEATTGIVGVCLFVMSIILVLIDAWKRRASQSQMVRVAATTLLIAAPALMIDSWFVNGFFYPFFLIPVMLLIGVMYTDSNTAPDGKEH